MKIRIYIVLLCGSILLPFATVRSEVAAGIILGEPTGVSIRVNKWPVLGLSWSMQDPGIYAHGDYYFIDRELQFPLRWYLGGGVALRVSNENSGVDARVPVGLLFPFDPKFELFGEIAPGIHIIPGMGLAIAGGIGLRYIFK